MFTGDTNHEERIRAEAVALFWCFVTKGNEHDCWLWTGPRYSRGAYPRFRFQQTETGAHRFSYEIHNGPIPVLLHVCHRCDVPLCVNPGHLFLATHKDNMDDMSAKGRRNDGTRISLRKLAPDDVRAVRSNAHISLETFAKRLGVAPNTIRQIRKHLTYKWVQP